MAAAAHFGAMAVRLFEADWSRLPDPTERVLGYVALRREIIGGGFEDFTCLLGTMVQETYASSPRSGRPARRGSSATPGGSFPT